MAAAVEMGEVDEIHLKEDDVAMNGDVDSDQDNSDEDRMSVDDSSQGVPNVDNSDCDTSEAVPKPDSLENGSVKSVELNDSGEDVVILDCSKENGEANCSGLKIMSVESLAHSTPVINLDGPPKKKKKLSAHLVQSPPRRSSRNLNKQKSYVESMRDEDDYREAAGDGTQSEESDIEEVLPQDPLAVGDPLQSKKTSTNSAIVVKDTKSLVEIASKTSPNVGGRKEPTLVIIDTNSILSGRGPVPLVPNKSMSQQKITKHLYSSKSGMISKTTAKNMITKPLLISSKPKTSITKSPMSSFSMLPMALPAQGVYPPNMRATITPIPMNQNQKSSSSSTTPQAPVLPTLTDDMFVVEAPSFIVPYVYEKPPLKEFKDFVKDLEKQIIEARRKEEEEEEENEDKKKREEDEEEDDDSEKIVKSDNEEKPEAKRELGEIDDDGTEAKKSYSYFDSPLGKFFVDIGTSLVQEFVQTDLLRQQKRKRDREGGQNVQTNKTIQSLIKNLEYSKENNVPFKMESKKCEFCSFKTESALAMSHHLETPHMKNYIYRCNFCTYEVRNPHDILFHMEAEHAVRGRLERAPAFHQCPNCPFEDNQKGKLTRHLVACMRKFKPERNLEPPVDWEPPAKIPRVPRMKQPMNAASAGVYQTLSKNQQYQMFSKMQQANTTVQRGRGRPSLGSPAVGKGQQPLLRTSSGMVYKQTMSGGSVLVPSYLSGNQLYQQQQQSSTNKKPVHQPSISITPLPRGSTTPSSASSAKPGDSNSKNSFVICEICDGYIKDLEQLRNHMQWIHKVKIHPKMIYNRPPLNCQKCQFRFFTDQGLERHLLGSHGLVTSSMQEAANKSKDAGRCPVCGRVYQWKLLNHVARDHNMTLKPAHLSYKCTVCTATFGMYKQFENHVYSAHSVVAKRVMDKKNSSPSGALKNNDTLLKPLKINDEITIIPQPAKTGVAGSSKEGSPSTGSTRNSNGNSVSVSSKSK